MVKPIQFQEKAIGKGSLKRIIDNPVKTAEAVNLIYVSDTEPGIHRIKKGKGFAYVLNEKQVNKKSDIERIKSLVIPPAWEQVWICVAENGHLQVTGFDAKKRKQYKYHPLWNSVRTQTKYYRLREFGLALPGMRLKIEKHLKLPGLPLEKVLATIVSLMERTHIRIGSNLYEKLYGSYGLTTLKDKHVKIAGTEMDFMFVGKKGVEHNIHLKNKKLSTIVKQCRDIPGKELFQYLDDAGKRHTVDSGMVNNYIKTISGKDFTAKDFRTWAGTMEAFMAFKEMGEYTTVSELKKNTNLVLEIVSNQLGNTKAVCKKYYVHPALISLYEAGNLKRYIKQLDKIEEDDGISGLTREEKVVIGILENEKVLNGSEKKTKGG